MLIYHLCAIFSLISAIVYSAYTIAGFRAAKEQPNADALINSEYRFAVSSVILVVTLVAFFWVNSGYLIAVALLNSLIQLANSIVGHFLQRRIRFWGPFILGIINFILLVMLINSL